MKKLWLAFIILNVFAGTANANTCKNLFQENDPVQNHITNKEPEIFDLIKDYIARLGPHQDPFSGIVNLSHGDQIFQRLSVRPKDGKWAHSSLGVINYNLKKTYSSPSSYNPKLVQWVIDDARFFLKLKDVELTELQSNLMALRYALNYTRRYKKIETVVDRDGNPQKPDEKKPDKKKPEDKKPEEEKKEEDSEPEYPELPEQYKPFTKDTEQKGDGKKQKKHRVAELNFEVPFFAQRFFSNISRSSNHPFQESVFPVTLPPPARGRNTGKVLTVRTFGKNRVTLFVPPLHKPLQPLDPRAKITRSESGGYVLTLTEPLNEVNIPVVEDTNISMMPHILELYTRAVGFQKKEWPAKLQTAILHRIREQDGKADPLRTAQAIADHLAKDYLYSVGPRSETDPVEALKVGAFQCDMAAYTMVALLRDVYKIPSRVVGGYRAKESSKGSNKNSYLVLPGEAHAWVEVFHDGRWNLFDPTPIKKDKKDDPKNSSADEYQDRKLENTPDAEPESNPESDAKPDSKPDSQPRKKSDHKKQVDQDTQKRVEETEKNNDKNKDKDEKDGDEVSELTKEDLIKELEVGSLELEPPKNQNVLLNRLYRTILKISIDPTLRGQDVQENLARIANMIRHFTSEALREFYNVAKSAHTTDHPGLKEWVEQVIRLASSQDVNKTYQEIHQIRSALEVYSKLLDREGFVTTPVELIETLKQAMVKLAELAHPDSKDIGLVQDFAKTLPAIVRRLLQQEFGLNSIGPNAQTKNLAKKLRNGDMNDLRLLSMLSPLSDFILNSTPRPEYIDIKTWQRDTSRPRGRDLLPLQRFSDLSRSIITQPGKSLEQNILDSTAYVLNRRKRVSIPAGHGSEEAERITIVLYDTSGSMSGEPGEFQAGLISAFTAKALSDVTPSGRHRHRVVIVPFDDSPGTPVKVTNSQEALSLIKNYHNQLQNTGGGTDIQKALLQAMALIADAEKRSGEPLAAANIVLMTDGGANINTQELYQARKAIDRQTPLQTMFIAINQTNPDLMKFAMDSQSMGSEKGFYREFTPDVISQILAESKEPLKSADFFYTDKAAVEIPAEVYNLLEKALRLAREFSDKVAYSNQYIPAADHLKDFEKTRWLGTDHADRPLEEWLRQVQAKLDQPIFRNQRLTEKAIDDLFRNMEQLTGIQFNSFSGHEQERLRHILRKAAGLDP